MVKRILIACCDEYVREIMVSALENKLPRDRVLICHGEADLIKASIDTEKMVIIFDKYFLGYLISYQILRIKAVDENIRMYFVETGNCSKYFGLRLHSIGINGLISIIETKTYLNECLYRVLNEIDTYPKIVEDSLRDLENLTERKSISEVTEAEMRIGIMLGQGFSHKEIADKMDMSTNAVNTHIHRLKRKIGYKKPDDYVLLNNQIFKGARRR